MTDAELLRKICKKKSGGLEAVIDRYGAYVATVIRNVLGTAGTLEDSEELSADVFFALWEHAEEVKDGFLKQWLGAVARNRAKDLLRKRKNTLPMDQDVISIPVASPEDQVLLNLKKQALLNAVKEMGSPDREIFLMYYYHFDTMEEIALRTGMPLGTVKSKLHRGKKRLKELFLEQEAEAWN